jgi:hypothetical protein
VASMPLIVQMSLKARGATAAWNAKAAKAAEKYFSFHCVLGACQAEAR